MIGPGEGLTSGILSLVENFRPVLEEQVTLLYLPSVRWRPLKESGKMSFRNVGIALSQYARFLMALVRFRPQIIHLHTSQGIAWLKDTFYILAGKAFGIRVILQMHGGNFDAIYAANSRFFQGYTRRMLALSDAVISVSSEWKNRFMQLFPNLHVVTLLNCIDLQTYQPDGAAVSGAAVRILFLGRIGPLKGAFDLIEAIHCLQPDGVDLHVWMVGPEQREGDFQQAQQLLEHYSLTHICELLGPVDQKKVLSLLRRASIFVLPSYYEGLPMAVLEALAVGLPVIATPVGGVPEVVLDGYNGLLIPVGNPTALARALETLSTRTALRQKMGQCSREIAEKELDVHTYVENLTGLYASLMK